MTSSTALSNEGLKLTWLELTLKLDCDHTCSPPGPGRVADDGGGHLAKVPGGPHPLPGGPEQPAGHFGQQVAEVGRPVLEAGLDLPRVVFPEGRDYNREQPQPGLKVDRLAKLVRSSRGD